MSDEIRYKNTDGTISFPGLGAYEIVVLEKCNIIKATDLQRDSSGFLTVFEAYDKFQKLLPANEKGLLLNCLNILLTYITRDLDHIDNPTAAIKNLISEKQACTTRLTRIWGVDLAFASILCDAGYEFSELIKDGDKSPDKWSFQPPPPEVFSEIMRKRLLSVRESQVAYLRIMAIAAYYGSGIKTGPGTVCPGGCH